MNTTPKPVHELAGQQDDPLAEEVLAVLFTDQPERASVRPGDARAHQQWVIGPPEGQSSRGWLSFAQPLTADVPALLKDRYESALRVAFVPRHASAVTVEVLRTAVNELTIRWTIERSNRDPLQGSVVLRQGG